MNDIVLQEIIPGLFIGNIASVTSHQIENIHLIINTTNVLYTKNNQKIYVDLDLSDIAMSNVTVHFDPICDLIYSYLLQSRKVLVHCIDGRSGSPSVAIAYLMKYLKLTLAESILYVEAAPEPSYFLKLAAYEKELTGRNSISIHDYLDVFAKN
jgi:protein-tyrosine phosphatase